MKGKMIVEGELVGVSDGPVTIPISPPNGGGSGPDPQPIDPTPPPPPPPRKPYFDIGDGEGAPGDVVDIVVEAGCVYPVNGFHIGGGVGVLPNVPRSGYGNFEAVGVKLGPFLRGYLEEQDLIHDEPFHKHDHFWSGFQFIKTDPARALPEEFWEYAIGFFSLDQRVGGVAPVAIPAGTELFTVQIRILPDTTEAQYTLTCKDEYYYTQSRQRRRDYLFTADNDSPFASGGVTKIETFPGFLRVKE